MIESELGQERRLILAAVVSAWMLDPRPEIELWALERDLDYIPWSEAYALAQDGYLERSFEKEWDEYNDTAGMYAPTLKGLIEVLGRPFPLPADGSMDE